MTVGDWLFVQDNETIITSFAGTLEKIRQHDLPFVLKTEDTYSDLISIHMTDIHGKMVVRLIFLRKKMADVDENVCHALTRFIEDKNEKTYHALLDAILLRMVEERL